jgi:TonB family protein
MKQLRNFLAILCIGVAFSFTIRDLSQSASYPGGTMAMDKYFVDSMRYPAAELAAGREEIIWVGFEVSEKGEAQHPRMTTLFGESTAFQEEVKRLIADMPLWTPALDKKGNPITSDYPSAIVRFILPDSVGAGSFPQDTMVYSMTEEMPVFRGGEGTFQRYLQWTIRYPQMEKEQGKAGTVYIYFEVAPSGKIENVRCMKGVVGAPGLAKEGIRVISTMPRWQPGTMAGKPVRASMTVPIKFVLR